MAVVVISGQTGRNREKGLRKLRCLGCEYLHENGNCLKVGGFYTSIADQYCPKFIQEFNRQMEKLKEG